MGMLLIHTSGGRSSCGGAGCLLLGILGLVAAFYIVKWTLVALFFSAPVLLGLALLIRPHVVRDAFMRFWEMFKRQPLLGLVYALVSVLAFPLIALSLFLQAVVQKQMGSSASKSEEYIDFEVMDSKPIAGKQDE